jgi:hypothetical protein
MTFDGISDGSSYGHGNGDGSGSGYGYGRDNGNGGGSGSGYGYGYGYDYVYDYDSSSDVISDGVGAAHGTVLTTTDGDGWVIHILITAAIAA